MKTLAT